jgi:hypothetical protein
MTSVGRNYSLHVYSFLYFLCLLFFPDFGPERILGPSIYTAAVTIGGFGHCTILDYPRLYIIHEKVARLAQLAAHMTSVGRNYSLHVFREWDRDMGNYGQLWELWVQKAYAKQSE